MSRESTNCDFRVLGFPQHYTSVVVPTSKNVGPRSILNGWKIKSELFLFFPMSNQYALVLQKCHQVFKEVFDHSILGQVNRSGVSCSITREDVSNFIAVAGAKNETVTAKAAASVRDT